MKKRIIALACAGALALTAPARAATEIQWWHGLAGALGDWIDDLAKGFNDSQRDYRVVPTFKGGYAESITAAIAGFRTKTQPHILLVPTYATAQFMAARGATVPVHELVARVGAKFDESIYLKGVVGYYADPQGRMLSLPFNSSTPVMYYNKDVFARAGLDPERPPKTWPEFEEVARKLAAAGSRCAFTLSWQEWIFLENVSAWHNWPVATKANGYGGLDTELKLAEPLQVHHLAWAKRMLDQGLFKYGGRGNNAQALFTTGQCAVMFNSSAGYAGVKKEAAFSFGIAMLPYWPQFARGPNGGPQNTIIGGASLWALAGHDPAAYRGIAAFFSYLSNAEVQAASHQRTGYLPITGAAFELTRAQGFYEKNPGTDTAIRQLDLNPPTENSRGIRLGNYLQIQNVWNEELEALWGGSKTAEQAAAAMVQRGNVLLRQFQADQR
ncbi:MAG: sn-glycerol-3-phosphate ABC transporter substrate-binding protein UgpB [Alphaproteobacteria bacterium]